MLIPLFSLFTIQKQVNAAMYSTSLSTNQRYFWHIDNVSSIISYWDTNFNPHGIISSSAGGYVKYTTLNIDEEIIGIFSMGNFTITDTNANVSFVLALSIGTWPSMWHPGLISSINWTLENTNAITYANIQNGTLTITNDSQKIRYEFHEKAGIKQNTTLIYNMDTGILLECYSDTGFVHVGLSYSHMETVTVPIGIDQWFIIIPCLTGIALIVLYIKKTRNNVVKDLKKIS